MEEPNEIQETETPKPSEEAPRPKPAVFAYVLVGLLAVALFTAGLFSYQLLFTPKESRLQTQVQELQDQLRQLQEQLAQLNEILTPLPRGVERAQVQMSLDDDPEMGSADAPITLVEFSDFQCTFCKQFYDQTLPQLRTLYVETGHLKFIYRDFPLPFHPNAQLAAEAAECAGEQAAYWAMHDQLFQSQAEWAETSQAKDLFQRYANSLGLDATQFTECLESQRYAEEVNQDLLDGVAYGVNATPTFFMNGYKLVGAQPFEVFQWVIETKLKR